MIVTDHPYIDNNGPSYAYGVCVHEGPFGECGKGMVHHSHRVTLRYPGTRSRQRKVVPVPDPIPISDEDL